MNSKEKYEQQKEDHIFWEPIKRFNSILTVNQSINIVNRLSLYCDNEELLQEVDKLKEYIKSKSL